MSPHAPGAPEAITLQDVPTHRLSNALAGEGVWLDLGLAVVRVRSAIDGFAADLQAAYRHAPFVSSGGWADLHVDLIRPSGHRRWLRPQVQLRCDGEQPFEPFPASHALPLLEWGVNWLIGRRFNHVLLLHAGVVERDGFALVMPAMPGSGKSTLTAALALRGWRLLSDEFGAFDERRGVFIPVLKPVALKNQSIDVIRRFAPDAELGPSFPKTRKGTVAHMAAPRSSASDVKRTAEPRAVVLPRWSAGSPTQLTEVGARVAFSTLAFNAFNYPVVGASGFKAVAQLRQRCRIWELVYGDLDDAVSTVFANWQTLEGAHAAARPEPSASDRQEAS